MSAYGSRAPLSNVTDRSVVNLEDPAHRQHGETDAHLTGAGGSTRCGNAGPLISYKADYTVQGQANAMEKMYSHRMARLQELGRNAGLSVRSQVLANQEVYRMGQTPSELLMSRSKNVYQPNLVGSIYGGELTNNVTSLQVHGTTNPSMGHKMTQKPLELPMSKPNVCPQPASGSNHYGGLTNVKSLQVHGMGPFVGTDYDRPPAYINSSAVRAGGNDRVTFPATSNAMVPRDMEAKIHQFEQAAYRLVLRAFQAQSDTITWEKHSVLTDLREELQISDNLHRELLKTVGNDDTIRQIREWRSRGGQASFRNDHRPVYDPVSNSNNSYGKRKETSGPGLNLPTPSPAMCSQQSAKPASSIVGKTVYPKGVKVDRGQTISGGSAIKSMASPGGPSGRKPYMNTYFPGNPAAVGSQAQSINPLIGHKVLNRCPDDNKFYEAVISDCNHETGQHKLVYDKNTSKEPWEWTDVKKAPEEDFSPPHNGAGERSCGEIRIFHTKSLIEEVEKVCSSARPDPLKIKQSKKALQIDVSDDDGDAIDVEGG